LFKDKKFLTLLFAFGTINGSFNIYGSIMDNIFDCYGFSSDEVSYLAAIMMIVGIVSAALIGIYIEKTLKYRRVFIPLALFGMVQCVGMPIMLAEIGDSFSIAAILVFLQGAIFIPLMPLSFDYGCDILFPAGEAQITGCLMTSGNFIGLVYVPPR
jgi:FLVCR family feline leukemia virus subgroup C receptor-related protein